MVLDQGAIKEFQSPQELLQKKDSVFYSMASDAGLVWGLKVLLKFVITSEKLEIVVEDMKYTLYT